MWLYGVLYTSSLIGTMALTLQIPLSIIADSFVRGASYSPMFNIGATCIFMAFIFVTISTHTMMPRNKIKVPRKVRHFCCCTCHKCKSDNEKTNGDSPTDTTSVQNKLGKLFRRKQQNDDTTEMKTLLADDSSDDDSWYPSNLTKFMKISKNSTKNYEISKSSWKLCKFTAIFCNF